MSSLTGPAGPIGPTGATGATGAAGFTGIGATGIGIISATGASGGPGGSIGDTNWITFYLTDGTTVGVSGARGHTGSGSEDFEIKNAIEGPDYGQIFQTKNGLTAYFKSLTVSGRDIVLGATSDYTILLDGITYERGRLGNTGELLYNFSGASAHGALNTYWSGNQLTARILTHRESKVHKPNNNIVIGDRVDVRGATPINDSTIAGTADVDGTIVSFTYITEHSVSGEDFTEKGMVSAFHLGKTGDDNVIYEFAGLTYDTIIEGSVIIGSCCFCENSYGPDHSGCVDYVNKTYCDSIGGSFSHISCLDRPEGPDCYPQGACCLLGGCTETSEEKCENYGGFFVDGIDCQQVQILGGCPDTCADDDDVGGCCINNICFELTEYQCSFEPNGVWIAGSCVGDDAINCCLETQNGACCLDEKCYNTSAFRCSEMRSTTGATASGQAGIFWGVGSKCAGPDDESLYYPNNCTRRGFGDEIFGALVNGTCPDTSTPPCTECVGWSQEISSDPLLNICAADGVECPCDSGDGQYGCNVCGSNVGACSTIITVDGTCWECCCESEESDTPPVIDDVGACCTGTTCSILTQEQCFDIGGNYFLPGQDCYQCPLGDVYGACCYSDNTCLWKTESECQNEGGTHYPEELCEGQCNVPVGICCGGEQFGQAIPCGSSNAPITESVCESISTEEHPSRWYTDTNHNCCGSCCWWGGDIGEETYHCDESGNKLFYDCENLANVNSNEAGTVPCYTEGVYQDVTWTSGDCSQANGNQGCPTNTIIGCCSEFSGEELGETSKCYCEQITGYDSTWVEGNCDPPPADEWACCLGDSLCQEVVDAETCDAFGGTFLNGTSCSSDPCAATAPIGACCIGFNCTAEVEEEWCNTNGGNYMGDGTSCPEGDYCGACCVDSECQDSFTQEYCESQDGSLINFYEQQDCVDVACEQPVGACCNIMDNCSDGVIQSSCLGTWCEGETCQASGGNGCGECVSNPAIGACCYRNAVFTYTCQDSLTEDNCFAICGDGYFNCTHSPDFTCQEINCGGGGGGGGGLG